MQIDHIALYTDRLAQMKQFYETYFHAKSNAMYHNPKTGLKTYFLSFDSGAKLEIMTRPNLKPAENEPLRSGYIHLSFRTGSKENVDELTRALERDGYEVFSRPRVTGDGYYESCVSDPDGNLIELVA